MSQPSQGEPSYFNLEVVSHQISPAEYGQCIGRWLHEILEHNHILPEDIMTDFEKNSSIYKHINLYDYLKLNLWNPSYIGNSNKAGYMGEQEQLKYTFNMYKDLGVDGYHISLNKVASLGYFAQMGLPVIPLKAVYYPFLTTGNAVLHSPPKLSAFLSDPNNYPLFGKPVRYAQSLGAVGLKSISGQTITTSTEQVMNLESYVEEVTRYFNEDGYLFQPLVTNHTSLHPVIGSTLATLRLLTVLTPEGFKLYRAAWKIPAQHNFADNYWRPGNLIAGVDIHTGCITHVVSGTGPELRELSHHPQTDVSLVGYEVPQWGALCELALQGSRLFPRMPIIGWDLALTDQGPVIVEVNDLPDFGIMQLADKRGILDGDLSADLKNILARYEQ